jgi:hypothetical protein
MEFKNSFIRVNSCAYAFTFIGRAAPDRAGARPYHLTASLTRLSPPRLVFCAFGA